MNLLRWYLALAVLLAPTTLSPARAVYDWQVTILAPSEWDWLPQAAFLPSLGVHRVAP